MRIIKSILKEKVHPKIVASIKSCISYNQLITCFNFVDFYKDVHIKNKIILLIELQELKLRTEMYNNFVFYLKEQLIDKYEVNNR